MEIAPRILNKSSHIQPRHWQIQLGSNIGKLITKPQIAHDGGNHAAAWWLYYTNYRKVQDSIAIQSIFCFLLDDMCSAFSYNASNLKINFAYFCATLRLGPILEKNNHRQTEEHQVVVASTRLLLGQSYLGRMVRPNQDNSS